MMNSPLRQFLKRAVISSDKSILLSDRISHQAAQSMVTENAICASGSHLPASLLTAAASFSASTHNLIALILLAFAGTRLTSFGTDRAEPACGPRVAAQHGHACTAQVDAVQAEPNTLNHLLGIVTLNTPICAFGAGAHTFKTPLDTAVNRCLICSKSSHLVDLLSPIHVLETRRFVSSRRLHPQAKPYPRL